MNKNKGFALVPILVLISVLSVLSFFGYYYYSNLKNSEILAINNPSSENNEDTDVLQATSGGGLDVNTFIYSNLFGVNNLAEFNRGSQAMILSTLSDSSREFGNCTFLPRASRPLTGVVRYGDYQARLTVYQNVIFQTLPKTISSKRYMAVSVSGVSGYPAISNLRFTISPIPNSCKSGLYIFEQPLTPINASNLNSLLNMSAYNTSVQLMAYKNSTSLYIQADSNSTQNWNAIRDHLKSTRLIVSYTEGDFKKQVYVTPTVTCPKGCDAGIELSIPYKFYRGTNVNSIQLNTAIDDFRIINITRFDRSGTCAELDRNSRNVIYNNNNCSVPLPTYDPTN